MKHDKKITLVLKVFHFIYLKIYKELFIKKQVYEIIKMPKTDIVPCIKEEMSRLVESSMDDDFFFMLFTVAKTTGRRLGELYGVEDKEIIGRKVVGKKKVYDKDGNIITIDKVIPIVKTTNVWRYGVQVKDINLDEKIMKVWVLKRRTFAQDETVLIPDAVVLIKQYIRKNNLKPEDHLFRKVTYRQIQNRIVSYAKKAKIGHKVSFHNFRHYFISELARKGWSHDKIAKFTGHKSIKALQTYDHILADDLRQEAEIVLRDL